MDSKIHRAPSLFANFVANAFFKKRIQKKEPQGYGHSRCQNETAPEDGKMHRTPRLFANFTANDFFKKRIQKSGNYKTSEIKTSSPVLGIREICVCRSRAKFCTHYS